MTAALAPNLAALRALAKPPEPPPMTNCKILENLEQFNYVLLFKKKYKRYVWTHIRIKKMIR